MTYPFHVFVDNAAVIWFQSSTCTCQASKLRGIFDVRDKWVKDLKDVDVLKAIKVDTKLNLADVFTKCLTATVRETLMAELARIAQKVSMQ